MSPESVIQFFFSPVTLFHIIFSCRFNTLHDIHSKCLGFIYGTSNTNKATNGSPNVNKKSIAQPYNVNMHNTWMKEALS